MTYLPDVVDHRNLGLLLRYPRVLTRLARNYLRVLTGNKRVLRGVEFCVTYRCQLNCAHCLTKGLIAEDRAEMTADQAVQAIADLAAAGAVFVNVTGGEPLLREDIYEILARSAADRTVLITLASNGLALDRDAAQRLARSGVAMVTLSLDGPDAASHDAARGREGAFEAVVNAAGEAKAAGMEVWFTTILTRDNALNGDAMKTAKLAADLGATLTVNLAYAVGNWRDHEALASNEEERVFAELLKQPHVRWEGSTNYLQKGCPAGTEKLYVTPYGDVMPCATIQRSFGNMLREPITDIWQRMGKVDWFDGRHKMCLVAQDENFIRRELPRIQQKPGGDWSEP